MALQKSFREKQTPELKSEEVVNDDTNKVACNVEATNVTRTRNPQIPNKPKHHATPQNPSLIHFFIHSSLRSQSCPFTLSNSNLTTSSAPCWTMDSSTSNSFTMKLRGYILFAATLSCERSPTTVSPPKAYFLLSLACLNSSRLILKKLVILLGVYIPDRTVLVQSV